MEESHHPPLPDWKLVEAHHPVPDCGVTSTDDIVVTNQRQPHATSCEDVNDINQLKEDNKLVTTRNNDITVNGISLMEKMKSKKTTSLKKTA